MGRVALPFRQPEDRVKARALLVLLLGLTSVSSVAARVVEGVDLPGEVRVAGRELRLNGAGLRVFGVFRTKVYVAALYTASPARSAEALESSLGEPLRLDLAYVRPFSRETTVRAWRWQFQQSCAHDYPGLARDLETFVGLLGALSAGGTETFELEGEELRVYDRGGFRGRVVGRDFQKAFLSLWVGPKPVTPGLKDALLGGGT
jgi:hypothetical protein